jgi:hypothetical protein
LQYNIDPLQYCKKPLQYNIDPLQYCRKPLQYNIGALQYCKMALFRTKLPNEHQQSGGCRGAGKGMYFFTKRRRLCPFN